MATILSSLEGRLAGQAGSRGLRQAVDVAARPEALEVTRGLLRAHVGRRPERRARQASRADPLTVGGDQRSARRSQSRLEPGPALGQPPVDHQRLAVRADDDVRRLDVAVQHAAAVRVVDGVADVEEPPQELAELKFPVALGWRRVGGTLVLRGLGRPERRRIRQGQPDLPRPGAWNRSIASLRLSPLMNRIA